MTQVDVVVVGGGPAGLYSATLLAQKGIRVAVLEEHPTAGTPVHCTGILFAEAFEEFGLSRSVILNELRAFEFHPPGGSNFTFRTSVAEAVVVDRHQLDRHLFRAASEAGVQFAASNKVRDISITDDDVVVRTDHTDVRAQACILACGANYTFQRKLNLGVPAVFMQSAQVEVPSKAIDHVAIYFGSDVAPGGFGWAVPVLRGNHSFARVGLMCDTTAEVYFRRFIDRISGTWGISNISALPRRKILPLSPIRKTYTDRLLVAGDAAGLVKPTTGGGIYFSLVSAKIAAGVLLEAYRTQDFSQGHLQKYERLWQRVLGAEIEAQLAVRCLAQRLPDEHIDELLRVTSGGSVMRLVKSVARFNSHRKLILTILRHPATRDVLLQAARA